MTGAEHYREAERLLAVCVGDRRGTPLDVACTAAAQVHATLALAAATALADYRDSNMTEGDQMAWYQAASAQPEHHRRRREAEAAEHAESTTEVQA